MTGAPSAVPYNSMVGSQMPSSAPPKASDRMYVSKARIYNCRWQRPVSSGMCEGYIQEHFSLVMQKLMEASNIEGKHINIVKGSTLTSAEDIATGDMREGKEYKIIQCYTRDGHSAACLQTHMRIPGQIRHCLARRNAYPKCNRCSIRV